MAATVGLVIRSLQLLSLSLLLSIPTIPSEQASERGEDTQSLRLGGGVAALYKEIRGYIDIGRLLLLLRLLRLLPPLRHNERRRRPAARGHRLAARTAAIRAAPAFPSVRPFPLPRLPLPKDEDRRWSV